ncbi:hypothetical protein PTTG_27886 [Puccinia triticina 1-1 BBBD Race 1]|uniref:Non-specific serine/threonine protein kinase n=1 Tax=Puccinia triticina (isolate 1-1 / race 1 (BBBD)) TaxID=630390 RepID=A0A180GHA9_PUCT1|nr:hypothetical protein PTTG_27886 [Puccinia triticina 1-1 BBBD Race 1]
MAQSSVNPMETQQESLYAIMRGQLTSLGISNVDEFFARDNREIKEQVLSLRSKLTQSIMASDLEEQLENATSRIKKHYLSGDFESFRPLIRDLLADEAKSDQEMYKFIDQEFNTPPSHQSFTPTSQFTASSSHTPRIADRVITGTLSGQVNSSSKVSDILTALQRELKNLMFTDVPGLLDHITQLHTKSNSLLLDYVDLASLLKPHESFINQTFDKRLADTSESSVLEWITPLLERISSSLESKISAQHCRTWRSQPNTNVEGTEGQRRLDAVITYKDKNHIKDILVPVELKERKLRDSNAALCLAKYVCEVFKAQPTRSYVVGFTLAGTSMRLWQFDRSGAIGSELLDIKNSKEHLYKFLNLITIFLTSNKRVLGFDPTCIDSDGQSLISIRRGPADFVRDRLLFRAPGIYGQEGSIFCDVARHNLPHVAQYYHHEDIHVASQQVDIESYIRGRTDFKAGKPILLTKKTYDPPVTFINRVHRRLILKDVGQPIFHADCPIRLLEALEGCITGHKGLLEAGYLHRDISTNNLMINKTTKDPHRKSFLIDLDLAAPYPSDDQARPARTGTKVFMSINLLKNPKPIHTYVDDLESFFWVFVWLCIHYGADPKQKPLVTGTNEELEKKLAALPTKPKKEPVVTGWNQQPNFLLALLKKACLAEPENLTVDFTPLYAVQPLIDCVNQFATIIRDPDVRGEDPESLYGKILRILREAREALNQSSA